MMRIIGFRLCLKRFHTTRFVWTSSSFAEKACVRSLRRSKGRRGEGGGAEGEQAFEGFEGEDEGFQAPFEAFKGFEAPSPKEKAFQGFEGEDEGFEAPFEAFEGFEGGFEGFEGLFVLALEGNEGGFEAFVLTFEAFEGFLPFGVAPPPPPFDLGPSKASKASKVSSRKGPGNQPPRSGLGSGGDRWKTRD